MAEQVSPTESPSGQKKPSLLAQAAKALSQLALTFYVLMLVVALLATAGSEPGVAIIMAILAIVPLIFGPGLYRVIGLVALLVAGGFYLNSRPLPKRPGAYAPQSVASAAAQREWVTLRPSPLSPHPSLLTAC